MPQSPFPTINLNDGNKSALWVTASTFIKAAPGLVAVVDVLQTGSSVGGVYDAPSTAAANTSNQVAVIPNTIGPIKLSFPCLTGITVLVGTNQVVSVSYR